MAPNDFPAGGYTIDYVRFWAVWLVIVLVTFFYVRARRGKPGLPALVTGNVLVLLSLGWTAVVAGETYLRYIYDATDSYGLTLTNFSWFRRHMFVNEYGFRDEQFPPGPPRDDVTRVVCIGDSFTAGYGVRNVADAWPQRLGAALAAGEPGRFEVRNQGIIGLSTGQEIQIAREALRSGGRQYVVLGYCLNDSDDLLPASRRFERESTPRVPLVPPTFSFVADFLWYRIKLRADPRVCGYFDWVTDAYTDPAIV
ncbi:MAG: SGNH/GDSL hydrolase family protein, partial [Planctomycetes bacterium]|nr:SGNH/GDSL hydrolase family protein [Planctomycetota bacterium]